MAVCGVHAWLDSDGVGLHGRLTVADVAVLGVAAAVFVSRFEKSAIISDRDTFVLGQVPPYCHFSDDFAVKTVVRGYSCVAACVTIRKIARNFGS